MVRASGSRQSNNADQLTGRRRRRHPPLPDALLYSISDVQAMGGPGRTKTYELIKEGKLETVWVGGRRKVVGNSLRSLANGST